MEFERDGRASVRYARDGSAAVWLARDGRASVQLERDGSAVVRYARDGRASVQLERDESASGGTREMGALWFG